MIILRVSFKSIIFFLTCTIFTLAFACNHTSNQKPNVDFSKVKQPLQSANKNLNQVEEEDIEIYIKRHNWQMTKTPTGLRYIIYQKGTDIPAKEGKMIEFKFSLSLINGLKLYSSDEEGNKKFEIGHGGVEAGLEEGLQYLHQGDKAVLIIPSHLGFGLIGDSKKVPRRATLIYDIEVISITNKVTQQK